MVSRQFGGNSFSSSSNAGCMYGLGANAAFRTLRVTGSRTSPTPLARTAFYGAFMETPDSQALSFAPDRLWLAFLHTQSQGALGRDEEYVFDPRGEFIDRQAARRAAQK